MDKRIKEEFTKDFETTSKKVDLSFDVNKLEPNTTNVKNKSRLKWIPLSIGLVCAATVAVVLPIALTNATVIKNNANLPKKDTIEFTKQQYNQNAIKVAESNTFKKLNYVPYPFNQS